MSKETDIPKTMSTQHPDNATTPAWSPGNIIEGEGELYEAFFAYNELGCNEVMWDSEGKDVDTHVIRKLLNTYPDYFKDTVLGRDVFLTYRIPNPQVELAERKIVTETLQVIPLSSDVASIFYKKRVTPIFEVILPFTTSGRQLAWIHTYYAKAISGGEDLRLDGRMKVKDWVGRVTPKEIRVIPLVEDVESLFGIDRIVYDYLRVVKARRLRVFIARSDPALNYGTFSAVLLSKIALSKLSPVQMKTGVEIYPIIGVGSMPFRGHLSPENVNGFLAEYRGVATVTTQSAFRYDYPVDKVKEAVRLLNAGLPNGEATPVSAYDEKIIRKVVGKLSNNYQKRIEALAPLIKSLSSFVPQRRARKLHIGLFGYGRSVRGIAMPRAIPFAAAFYSLGIPPEFVGAEALGELGEEEWDVLRAHYHKIKEDFVQAGALVSWENVNALNGDYRRAAKRAGMQEDNLKTALGGLMSDLAEVEEALRIRSGPRDDNSKRHENFINNFLISYLEGEDGEAGSAFLAAAKLRHCIG